MIERQRGFEALISSPTLRTKYQQEIYEGLALEEATFLEIPRYVQTNIVSKIESSFIALSKILSIPVPEIGLTMSWSGESYIRVPKGDRIEDIIAQADFDESNQIGIVRYSPFYLKSLISNKLGVGQDIEIQPHPLEGVTAHEGFHIWQYMNQGEQIKRDFQIALREGSRGFNQTRTEQEAIEFQNSWLRNNYRRGIVLA